MTSAWGDSWGDAWGDSWGERTPPPPVVTVSTEVGGGGISIDPRFLREYWLRKQAEQTDRARSDEDRQELLRIVVEAVRGKEPEPEQTLPAPVVREVVREVRREVDVAGLQASVSELRAMIAEFEAARVEWNRMVEDEEMAIVMVLQ